MPQHNKVAFFSSNFLTLFTSGILGRMKILLQKELSKPAGLHISLLLDKSTNDYVKLFFCTFSKGIFGTFFNF